MFEVTIVSSRSSERKRLAIDHDEKMRLFGGQLTATKIEDASGSETSPKFQGQSRIRHSLAPPPLERRDLIDSTRNRLAILVTQLKTRISITLRIFKEIPVIHRHTRNGFRHERQLMLFPVRIAMR
jgi:hypothetical protein